MKTFFLVFTPEYMEIHAYFEKKIFGFFVFIPEFVEFREEDLCFFVHTLEFELFRFGAPPQKKNYSCPPPSHAILAPGLLGSTDVGPWSKRSLHDFGAPFFNSFSNVNLLIVCLYGCQTNSFHDFFFQYYHLKIFQSQCISRPGTRILRKAGVGKDFICVSQTEQEVQGGVPHIERFYYFTKKNHLNNISHICKAI